MEWVRHGVLKFVLVGADEALERMSHYQKGRRVCQRVLQLQVDNSDGGELQLDWEFYLVFVTLTSFAEGLG